ncbi:MAG: Xylose isomerase [bacterium ADurb.Bin429]|nr:MAG: Xylose isomerase [bacterium ADurb.Bin429]
MPTYRTDLIQPIVGQTSFGIWDLLNKGSDPFGAPTRAAITAEDGIRLLGKIGVPFVSLHDLDVGLDPWVTPNAKALDARKAEIAASLRESGVQVWMYTPCLFHHPLVRAGSVTANDARVRRMSLQKMIFALDVAEELGARWLTFWLGRDGAEVDALIDAKAAYARIADAVAMATAYIRGKGYQIRISLEPKPNEPRGDIYVATVGHALGIINLLPEADRNLVGVNPELLQHEAMAGLNGYHAIGLLAAAGKLAFLHLGGQTPLRYDQDHPFLGGNSDLKQSFYIILGMLRHAPKTICEFDCHPFRTEAGDDAREAFIRGNLEALGIMVAKAKSFLALPEARELLAETDARGFGFTADPATDPDGFRQALFAGEWNADTVAASLSPNAQALDRLVNLHLLGMA